MSAQALRRYSVSDYLALERESATKHEYHEGEILAMAGASPRHDRIVLRVLLAMSQRLQGQPCEVFTSDIRVRLSSRFFTYPDVKVGCGQAEWDDEKPPALLNPTAIFEVLSPSTAVFDQGEKAVAARQLDTLSEYVLIAQQRILVQHYQRQADGSWRLLDLIHAEAMLRLSSLGIEIPIGEFYLGVKFDEDNDT